MIVWEPATEGYLECVGTEYSGVVGLAHPRSGWMARLDTPDGRRIAPVLYHTAHEAKRWVERQLEERGRQAPADCAPPRAAPGARDAPGRRVTTHMPRRRRSGARPWLRDLAARLCRAFAQYQQINARFLDPQQIAQPPLCYATAESERRAAYGR